MLTSRTTRQFRKDAKRVKKQSKNIEKLIAVINLLLENQILPPECRDHLLKGDYVGRRECHLEPDWLLIYRIDHQDLILERTGSHSDLFN